MQRVDAQFHRHRIKDRHGEDHTFRGRQEQPEKQQEKGGALNNDTSFRVLDKNNDGYLTKAEAAGNPDLAKRFKEADTNKDGKLSRAEYLKVMAKIDTHNAADKVSKSTDGKAASGGTKQK